MPDADPDRAERIFDHLLDDLARSPTIAEDDIDGYVRDTRARLAASNDRMPAPDRPRPPTEVELAALRCMSRGMTVQMTAETLGKGEDTIRTQLAEVRPKLGAKNTTHACCEAIRRGLIP